MVSKPEVYKSDNCYIVFGEVRFLSLSLSLALPCWSPCRHLSLTLGHLHHVQAKVEDQSGLIAAHQQQQFLQNQMAAQAAEKQHALASKSSEKQKEGGDADEAEGEEEDDGDETGLKDSDIELVMGQANCSRAKAVKALKQGGGDLGVSCSNAHVVSVLAEADRTSFPVNSISEFPVHQSDTTSDEPRVFLQWPHHKHLLHNNNNNNNSICSLPSLDKMQRLQPLRVDEVVDTPMPPIGSRRSSCCLSCLRLVCLPDHSSVVPCVRRLLMQRKWPAAAVTLLSRMHMFCVARGWTL